MVTTTTNRLEDDFKAFNAAADQRWANIQSCKYWSCGRSGGMDLSVKLGCGPDETCLDSY